MGTYVPPLPLQNFLAKITPVKAVWLNAVDNLLQGNIPATGIYNAGFVSGQVQVTGPNGYMTSYGDLGFALQSPGPLGTGPFLRVAGAGKVFGQIGTDAQVPNQNGINLSLSAGDVAALSSAAFSGGNLLITAGSGAAGLGGDTTVRGGTSATGNAGNTFIAGGNATAGIAGNLYLSGGLNGPLGGGSVHLIMTATGGTPGSVVIRVDSTILYTITQSGAIFIGASGAGVPGQVLTSGGPNALPSWSPTTGGGLLYPTTAVEIAAGVTPTSFAYPFGDLRRYGATGDGVADDSVAWATAISVGYVFIPTLNFKIVTPATSTGQVIIQGAGKNSKLLCDGTVLTVTNGTGSTADNFWMENITPPYIIIRNPANWSALPTNATSNTVLGYQPTVNDQDIWATLTAAQQNQQIGPVLIFTGLSTNIEISRIYGRFVQIIIQDSQYSTVRDCDIRGGKGTWGAIQFDNAHNNLIVGQGNKAIGNTVQYASFSGINFQNSDGAVICGNTVTLCGESGIKTASAVNGTFCIRSCIIGNTISYNYYDGIDTVTTFPTNSTIATYNQITGNVVYGQGGDGVNVDGQFASVIGNQFVNNGRFGIWCTGANTKISGNYCYHNNLGANPSIPDILGGADGNQITDNFIVGTGVANAIYYPAKGFIANNYASGSNFFFGNPGVSIVSLTSNNVDPTTGLATDQSFLFWLQNNGGTLQHIFYSDASQVAPGWFQRIVGASSGAFFTTPTGTDASTAFGLGCKISTNQSHAVVFNTAAQSSTNILMLASIVLNTTGVALTVRPLLLSFNVNGVILNRLLFEFFNAATGAAVALNATNIPTGTAIQVQFLGKLA